MYPQAVEDLDTPVLVVDLDAFEANVERCMQALSAVNVRPHLKTAKSPVVAGLLLQAGATGICVAKLGEAEVMLDNGIDDLLITTELVGPTKLERLAGVLDRWPNARLLTVVDSWDAAFVLNQAISRPIETLIDVNVGQNRCGVLPSDAVALARRLQPLEHLRVVGVQGYEGNLQHIRDPRERQARCDQAMRRLEQAVETLLADGHAVDVVTTGGTGTAEYCARHPFVTEVQPGSFIFMDADYLATGGLSYVPALTLISTVISHTTPNRAVVDAGLKSLSDDSGPAQLHELPGWTYAHAGDEHGVLTASPGADRAELHIGDRVTLIPSHIDTTVNLHDEIYACRGGAVVGVWPIAARGLVR